MQIKIEEGTDAAMQDIASHIHGIIGNGYGFAVLVFPFGELKGKTAHYISNCKREDMVRALREQANVLEQKQDVPNSGLVQ